MSFPVAVRHKQLNATDVESFAVTIRNGIEKFTLQERRKHIELLLERIIVVGKNFTVKNFVPLKGVLVFCLKIVDVFHMELKQDWLRYLYQRTLEILLDTAKLSPLVELLL